MRILITAGVFCIYIRTHHPRIDETQFKTQERYIPKSPKNHERKYKKKYNDSTKETTEDTEESNNTTN